MIGFPKPDIFDKEYFRMGEYQLAEECFDYVLKFDYLYSGQVWTY